MNHVDTIAAPGSGTSANASSATPEECAQLVADVEAYCQEIRPIEEIAYLEHEPNPAIGELAKKYNMLGMSMPKKYGGRAVDSLTYARALVRINREGTGVRTFFSGHTSIGQYPILKYGTEEQKDRYLPASCRGDCTLAFGLTEPDAGSNPLEGTCTWRREGDKFILNGVKYLISNGSVADAVIVFAFPEGSAGQPDRRMSAFIVDTAGDTFEAEALHAKPGMYTSDTAMFEMTDHPISGDNMLGDEGNGFRIAMHTLVSGRLSVASGCLGTIEDCLEECLRYARERKQHGKPIGKHQLVQQHIARIEMMRSTADALVERAAIAKDKADAAPGDKEELGRADFAIAEAKYWASNAAWEAVDRAVQVFGGRGWSELYRPFRHLQDVRVCRIYEGTDEIMQLKIASSLLGKEFAAFG
ncbi:MAG: acyl-CoA/acyl-ACP dehydrogenase [Phycisphaerales bacterium]|nr:acyl-CoA/acyl-ACP dehydrogenase [Phycisphaerales bacterium]MDG2132205.1 acyl-CoA/acyl-ACP dehydrogenase [Phycisphaerales bacterium]